MGRKMILMTPNPLTITHIPKPHIIPTDPDTELIRGVCKGLIGSKITIGFTITLPDGDIHSGESGNCNIVGDCMEDILLPFLKSKVPTLEEGPPQASPDFFNRGKEWEWELKVFKGSANFDISNFNSYVKQLEEDAYRKLKTQYLIFKYSIENQTITITDFKLHNVWDMISYNGKNPISLQNKKGTWYNIRPCSFSQMGIDKSPSLFIESICKAILECPNPNLNKDKSKDEIIDKIRSQWHGMQL